MVAILAIVIGRVRTIKELEGKMAKESNA